VTITITATINAAITGGTTISNQGTFSFDGNADGTNESNGVTNDPATPAGGDPTVITVAGGVPAVAAIPTLSDFGFAALAFLLAMAAFFHLRRRRVS
jgi:IPTL-CTERM motif